MKFYIIWTVTMAAIFIWGIPRMLNRWLIDEIKRRSRREL